MKRCSFFDRSPCCNRQFFNRQLLAAVGVSGDEVFCGTCKQFFFRNRHFKGGQFRLCHRCWLWLWNWFNRRFGDWFRDWLFLNHRFSHWFRNWLFLNHRFSHWYLHRSGCFCLFSPDSKVKGSGKSVLRGFSHLLLVGCVDGCFDWSWG